MDDIEFARRASPQLSAHYEQAKKLSLTAPAYALTFLRSFATIFCEEIDPRTGGEKNLSEKIKKVRDAGQTSTKVLEQLRSLQRSGNQAVHPEEYDWTTLDFSTMVERGLSAALFLLEHLYWLRHGDVTLPTYTIEEPTKHIQQELSYRAVFEEDGNARSTLGLHFKEKADRLQASGLMQRVDDGYGPAARSAIDQAVQWFKAGAECCHAGAMYEYGAYLARLKDTNLNSRKDKRQMGERYVWQASNEGNADALALLGDFYFSGSALYDVDLSYARELYEKAAVQSHPRALAQLGKMYEHGLGGPKDIDSAFRCSLKAAEAGFPQAQFHLYSLHRHKKAYVDDYTAALHWLTEAAAQKHPDAMIALADLIAQQRVPGRAVMEAQPLYEACIQTPRVRIKALYSFASLSATHSEELDELNAALNYALICKDEVVYTPKYHESLLGCERIIQTLMSKIQAATNRKHPGFSFQVPVAPSEPTRKAHARLHVGRNDPCPCGSEKKFKHCCI